MLCQFHGQRGFIYRFQQTRPKHRVNPESRIENDFPDFFLVQIGQIVDSSSFAFFAAFARHLLFEIFHPDHHRLAFDDRQLADLRQRLRHRAVRGVVQHQNQRHAFAFVAFGLDHGRDADLRLRRKWRRFSPARPACPRRRAGQNIARPLPQSARPRRRIRAAQTAARGVWCRTSNRAPRRPRRSARRWRWRPCPRRDRKTTCRRPRRRAQTRR